MINSHAIQSQNISKFTGNISKNTSKFTSKTNSIRLGGGHGGHGLPGDDHREVEHTPLGAMGLGRARGTKALGTARGSTCSPTKGPSKAYCETLVRLVLGLVLGYLLGK